MKVFPSGSAIKNLLSGLIPGSGRYPEEANGNPLQYYCLGNLMDRGAWQATVTVLQELDNRNDMDLTEAEDIKKRCQGYTEELYKNIFTTQIITRVWSLT